jgi:hypothetical protein
VDWTSNNRDGSSPVSTISIEEYTVNIIITTYKLLSCLQLLMHGYHHPINYRCMHRRSFGFQAHVTNPRHFAIWAIRSLDWSFVSNMKEKEITETLSSFLTPASINTRPSSWEPRAVGAWLVTWSWRIEQQHQDAHGMTDHIEDRRGEAEDREMTCTYTSPPAAKRLVATQRKEGRNIPKST